MKEIELGGSSIGTTKKGIGPAYSSKASRSGLRVHHLYDPSFPAKFRKLVEGRFKRYGHFEFDTEGEIEMLQAFAERLRPHVVDGPTFMHQALAQNKRILVEGANALMLDIDYGTYPYVTSSATAIGGVITGLGIPPFAIKKVIGVVKAYTTRVGGGPFPTEQLNQIGETFQEVGAEYGTTTGRRRRCGWLDLVVMKYSTLINGYTSLNLTKLDVLDGFEEIKIATGYKIDGVEITGFPGEYPCVLYLRNLTVQPISTAWPKSKSSTRRCPVGNPTSARLPLMTRSPRTARSTSSSSRTISALRSSTSESVRAEAALSPFFRRRFSMHRCCRTTMG